MMLTLLAASSAVTAGPTTLADIVALTRPYVECRRSADQRVVVLQQQIQSKRIQDAGYDMYSDENYHDLQDIILKAEEDCDLQKYVSLVNDSVVISGSYDDFQKKKMAEFLIQDVIKLEWTFINALSGAYQFPRVATVPSLGQTKK